MEGDKVARQPGSNQTRLCQQIIDVIILNAIFLPSAFSARYYCYVFLFIFIFYIISHVAV